MSDRIVKLAELVDANHLEISAGRPRSVDLARYPIPILRVADVLDGKIESSHQGSISEASAQELGPKVSRVGDVVLTTKGTVGRVAIMPPGGPLFAYSPQLCYFRAGPDGPLRARYLYYWFKSADFWNQANVLKGQTDMADFLSLADIYSLKMRLPPLVDQARIAAALGVLDDKIAVNERIAATADALASAFFEASERKERYRLEDVACIVMGQSPPGETYNEAGNGIPFYQGVRDFGMRHPGHRVWCTGVTRYAGAGDVLVSVRAPVGTINVAEERCGIGRGVAAIRAVRYPHVLLHALSSDGSVWRPYEAEGTVFGSINKKQLALLEVSWPNVSQVEAVEDQLSSLDRQVSQALRESHALSILRDTLLPQLMSGRLRVKDAEKIVEDHV